jgi:hypothetical protein
VNTVLLDVNVLIALLWPTHEHYDDAHAWFVARGVGARWATCPLTELAFVRIVSNPGFSADALAPQEALSLLERNLAHPGHDFWADDVDLVGAVGPLADRLQGHRQLADAYLLALATRRRGALATFDGGLRALAVGERSRGLELVPTGRRARP